MLKKIILIGVILIITILLYSSNVYAVPLQATISVSADKNSLTPGETVTFTLRLQNVANAEGGIVSGVAGTIEYDTNIFEDLNASGIIINKTRGNWSTLGSFSEGSVLGTISLKAKNNVSGTGNVIFKDLIADDGRDDLSESTATSPNVQFSINVNNPVQVDPDPEEPDPYHPDDPDPVDPDPYHPDDPDPVDPDPIEVDPNPYIPDDPEPVDPDPIEVEPDDPEEPDDPYHPSDPITTNPGGENKSKQQLPKTGKNKIIIAILTVTVVSVIIYFKCREYKEIK